MSGPELKPCPFCGESQPPHDDTSWVRCMGCGAESGWRADGEEAAAAWNTRAALPEVQAIVDAAVEIARATAFVLGREAGEKAERESCARLVDCGCDKRQKAAVIEAKTSAERARACGQYNCGAEDAAAIRKRVED